MLYYRESFCDLPIEITVMILYTMTATELIDFRCCFIAFNTIFTANEPTIIREILRNHFYHAAAILYGILSAPGKRKFKDLKQIARRCDIADMLATSVAERHLGQGFTTMTRMAKNVKPYILSMGHFFERYRLGLANYTPASHHAQSLPLPLPLLPPASRTEQGILRKHYNGHTAQRVCLTYHLLNDILVQKIYDIRAAFRRLVSYLRLSLSEPTSNICTSCGLEMPTHILTHPRLDDRLSFIMSHYIKTTPVRIPAQATNIPVVALPPSVLGP